MQFATKRIYEPTSQADGFRVLVDRLWPRGIKKEKAAIDLWAKDLAPTPEMRKWFSHEPQRFEEFIKRYRQQLDSLSQPIQEMISAAGGHEKITLLYAARDTQHNHAIVLQEWLESIHR